MNIGNNTKLFCLNKSGAASIEFAILFPILAFLFVGMVELTTAVSYDRRVSKAGAAAADLVSRSKDVTNGLDDIDRAIEHQMAPFEDVDIDVRVGMILIRNNQPQVVWSWENRGRAEPWPQGSQPDGISFSKDMLINGQYYVISTSQFEYRFLLGAVLNNLSRLVSEPGRGESDKFVSISLRDSFIYLPRIVSCVEFEDNCANWPL